MWLSNSIFFAQDGAGGTTFFVDYLVTQHIYKASVAE
jgi:hypothetical protein